jgi:hypothetical protein
MPSDGSTANRWRYGSSEGVPARANTAENDPKFAGPSRIRFLIASAVGLPASFCSARRATSAPWECAITWSGSLNSS